MRHHYLEEETSYWGVGDSTTDPEKILLGVNNDKYVQTSCRVRLTPDEAREMGQTLLNYAQDFEKKNETR
jgi:hypothetical protein